MVRPLSLDPPPAILPTSTFRLQLRELGFLSFLHQPRCQFSEVVSSTNRTSSALTMSGMLKNVFGGAESSGEVKPDDGKLSVRSSIPILQLLEICLIPLLYRICGLC